MPTIIISDDTVKALIEAHASMAAWYYQMSEALRTAGVGVEPPSDATRLAYVKQIGDHFPEIAQVAAGIDAPRAYVPPPAIAAPAEVKENEGVVVAAPPSDHLATPDYLATAEPEKKEEPKAPPPQDDGIAPPPMVDPNKVKYD